MRYFISDLHFFHNRLNEHLDCRGFASGEEMNAYMIRQWNSRVRNGDEVVVLGDFSIGNGKETSEVLRQLNGRKYLIIGNHDRYRKEHTFDTGLFEWMRPYEELRDNRRKIILSHYPVFCYNGQYDKTEKGGPKSYMLYGHVHDSYDEVLVNQFIRQTREAKRTIHGATGEVSIPCHMINCFCMYSDYVPLTLEEWIELDEKRRKNL